MRRRLLKRGISRDGVKRGYYPSNTTRRILGGALVSGGACAVFLFASIRYQFSSETRILDLPVIATATVKISSANIRGSGDSGTDSRIVTADTTTKTNLAKAGFQGGAWTAETHLSEYGFNVDWGLLEVLESSCRDIENSRIPEGETKWEQYNNTNRLHPLIGWWKAPDKKYINCKVLEVGCGVGVYVDALKKENAKRGRTVIGIEPNPMGGTFNRRAGPKQLAIDLLAAGDQAALATKIRNDELGGEGFDLIYSIEVMEHMPLDRHDDAVNFLAASARKGTKLIFGAATPGQTGVGHIGPRKQPDWLEIMARHNFIKHDEETGQASHAMQEYNHRVNTLVYYYEDE